LDLVFVPGFVSHVEHFWEDPSLIRFANAAQLIRRWSFSWAGLGQTRIPPSPLL